MGPLLKQKPFGEYSRFFYSLHSACIRPRLNQRKKQQTWSKTILYPRLSMGMPSLLTTVNYINNERNNIPLVP
jgi:hypothetical protein